MGVAALLGSLLLLLAPLGPAAAQSRPAAEPAIVEISRDPAEPVLSYALHIDGIRDPDPGPSLVVFGDGRVRVHYPHYMRRAGDYELHLGEAELQRFVRSVAEQGLVELDVEAAEGRKRDLARAMRRARSLRGDEERRVESRSAASLTEIELRLDRYRAVAEVGPPQERIVKRLRWRGLRTDARRYAGLPEIQSLDSIRGELEALMRRPELRRVTTQASPARAEAAR